MATAMARAEVMEDLPKTEEMAVLRTLKYKESLIDQVLSKSSVHYTINPSIRFSIWDR
jgi:hypothetical protein